MTRRLLPILPHILPLLAAVVLAFGGPARAAPPDEAGYREIATRFVASFAAPASQAFLAQAKNLTREATAACKTPGAAPEALRQAFRDAAAAWGRLSLARFGPLSDNNRYDKIAFWPDPRGVIRRQTYQLAAQMPAEGDLVAWIGGQSAAVQGLPAFDLLAFGDERERNCRMAAAVAGNIERLATGVAAGFADAARLAMLTPKEDSPLYRTWADSLAHMFNAYTTQIQVLSGTIISGAIAATPNAEAKPTRLFLRHAPATKAFLAGAADGIAEALAAMQLDPFLAGDPQGLREQARRSLQTANVAINGLPIDMTSALGTPAVWHQLSSAARGLEDFNKVVSGGYTAALGLKAGFNSLDGD